MGSRDRAKHEPKKKAAKSLKEKRREKKTKHRDY
jgi:hypothetical protein